MLQTLLLVLLLQLSSSSAGVPTTCPPVLTRLQQLPELKQSKLFIELLTLLNKADPPIVENPNCSAPKCDSAGFDPVCSTKGNFYPNTCYATACGATVACKGGCPCTAAVKKSAAATVSQQAVAPRAAAADKCDEDQICPDWYDPVCTTDKKDYSSECEAKRCGKTVACKSPCSSCTVTPETPICPSANAPVCDVASVTHRSPCVAKAASASVACLGKCPCPDLLNSLKTSGGTLLIPTDTLLKVQLGKLNVTLQAAKADKKIIRALLGPRLSLVDLLKKDGTRGLAQAGNNLQYLVKGPAGKPVVLDLTTGVNLGITKTTSLCSKVKIVQVGSESKIIPVRKSAVAAEPSAEVTAPPRRLVQRRALYRYHRGSN